MVLGESIVNPCVMAIQSSSMELPIAPSSYQPSPDALIRAAKRAEMILARTVAQETQLDAATLFVHPDRPRVGLANLAMEVRLPDGLDAHAVVRQILDPYEQAHAVCFKLQAAEAQWPESLAHALSEQGYQPVARCVHALTRQRSTQHRADSGTSGGDLQIIPARAAYAQLRNWYQSLAARESPDIPTQVEQEADTRIDLLDEPRLEMFFGRIQGQPVGTAGVLTLGQIGVLHGLCVDPQHPQGAFIQQALLTQVIDHCARAQFEQVIVDLPKDEQATHPYRHLGFEPTASYTTYHTRVV